MKLTCTRGEPYEYEETESKRQLFSVSQIRRVMDDSMSRVPISVLEPARLRGTLLHQRFWKLLASRVGISLMPSTIEHYAGYCRAMDTWADHNRVSPIRLEEPSANLKLGYAGCVDSQLYYGDALEIVLIDLKTGHLQATDIAQLLLYDEMDRYKSDRLLDLYVRNDGTYKEVWVTKKDKIMQWPWAMAALNVLKSRRNHNITI